MGWMRQMNVASVCLQLSVAPARPVQSRPPSPSTVATSGGTVPAHLCSGHWHREEDP